VIRSWLLDLLVAALDEDPRLDHIQGWAEDSGEGRWTIEDAIDKRIPTPVITTSLYERFSSRGQNAFAAKVNAALRNQFGGHAVKSRAQTEAHAE
jgi:6-phosphogluconate dehydrogenase